MIWDLVVIGGGYWGTAIAYEAQSSGVNTLLLDDNDPMGASRAASGIVDPKVYFGDPRKRVLLPDDWTKADVDASLGWFREHCGPVELHGTFLNLMNGATEPRPEKLTTLHLLYPKSIFMMHPRTYAQVTRLDPIQPNYHWGIWTTAGQFVAKTICIAAGYRTDDVLEMAGLPRLGVTPLFGRGLIFSGRLKFETPLTVMTRPYTKYTIRPWEKNGVYRIGDTAELNPNPQRADELETLATKMLATDPNPSIQMSTPQGYRPTLPKFTVKEVGRGVIVATGGHRVGLGLVGHVAKTAVRLVKG